MPDLKRLKKLAEAVELAPEDRFDMTTWIEQKSCGTAACAAGWYAIATAPEFGWRIEPDKNVMVLDRSGKPMREDEWADHFGIEWEEAYDLFMCSAYDPED